ncbi:uncharacterized protein TNCV_2911591 [Trichonephila clavipes]|nr:uncharacterized protein TNCV_2911591 [Trichonephila clavipes]
MNLPQPPTRFAPYGKRILNAAKLVYEDSIQNAAKEAICENEGNKNIAVAVDGTWKKRGYTSLNGVVTVTSIDTVILWISYSRNHSSVQNMRQAIWAIFLHKLSTDEYPQHGFCPIGEDSWCGFKKAEASARDLDESPDPSMSKIVLRNLIISSKYYKEEEAKELLEVITAERIANQSANQNNGQTSRVKSLDEIVKMVRLLTVKVPNKSDGWEYFFSSLEKGFR